MKQAKNFTEALEEAFAELGAMSKDEFHKAINDHINSREKFNEKVNEHLLDMHSVEFLRHT